MLQIFSQKNGMGDLSGAGVLTGFYGYFATYQRFFLPQSLDAEGRRKVFTSVDAFTLQHAIEWANSNPLCFLDACNVCIKNDVAFERSNHFRSRVRRA
ncbi:unnamed protein product [Ixodes persulcatus]